MRAGPDVAFPQVAYLGRGLAVNVVGCTEGWQWCDVIAGPNRGWVASNFLSYSYYNRPTLISYGGANLGIPLVSFAIAPYWENYYRGRPFWGNRTYWYNHRVARAPDWHSPPGWQSNNGRGYDNRNGDYRGNNGYNGNNQGNNNNGNRYGNNNGNHYGNNNGNNNRRGQDDRRAYDPRMGPQHSANTGPDPRPHINDQNHPNEQQ